VTKARISAESVEVEQHLQIARLEEANAQLHADLVAAHTNVEEVERREWSLTSEYDGLHRDSVICRPRTLPL
jgi:hypothetical protein